MKKILSTICILGFLVSCSSAQDVSVLDGKSGRDETIGVQTILALGDSLTAGYGVDTYDNYTSKLSKLLSQNNYNYEIINAGISGDTSGDLLSRSSEYLENDPDIVLLVIGGNDGLQKKSTDEMKENILDIIDIYDNGERKIVLGGIQMPITVGLNYSRSFNSIHKEISKERKQVYFLKEFLDGVAGYAQYNQSDRIHPTSQGYDIIVENLYEFLRDEDIIIK